LFYNKNILGYSGNVFIPEEFCLLGYNAVQSGESQPRRNILPPSSGLEIQPSKKPALLAAC
jgi:hypothetical protein